MFSRIDEVWHDLWRLTQYFEQMGSFGINGVSDEGRVNIGNTIRTGVTEDYAEMMREYGGDPSPNQGYEWESMWEL